MAVLAALTVFAAIMMLVMGLLQRRSIARVPLERRLARAAGLEIATSQPAASGPALRDSRKGRLDRVLVGVRSIQELGQQIQRAGWRLSAGEFLMLAAFCGVLAGLIAWWRLPMLAIPAALLGGLLPLLALKFAVKRRRGKFSTQLVDALALIANAIKAGVGLMQAIDQAAGQLEAPIADEFRNTLRDIRLGATPDDAFAALNQRVGSDDLDIVLTAIIVQRTTGGNLAEILENVAATMRERIRIRGEIKTLTAQQQLSGYLVAGVPIALLGIFHVVSPNYVTPLFSTTAGHAMLAVGGVLQVIGFLVIRKIVNIEV